MRCKLFLCSLYLYSPRISAIFDHFGYPFPQLDQWQQCIWYDLGATQNLLHHIRNCLAKGLPTAASLPRVEPPISLYMPPSMVTRPAHGGKFIKALKGGGPPQNATTAGPSSATTATPPKTEAKKRKKKKRRATPKCTVTSGPYLWWKREQKWFQSPLILWQKAPLETRTALSAHLRIHLTLLSNQFFTHGTVSF